MTKKHFIEIAKILKDYNKSKQMGLNYDLVGAFSDFCGKYNKNFKKLLFLNACKVDFD